jgi:hypothetical protein
MGIAGGWHGILSAGGASYKPAIHLNSEMETQNAPENAD